MQINRSSYFFLFAIYLLFILPTTINQFSRDLFQQTFFLLFGAGTLLVIVGLIIAVKDKEVFHIITDERTRRIDRSAGYYSWWFTLLFGSPLFVATDLLHLTASQAIYVIFNVMYVTILIFHMYFNFKGKEA